MCVFQANYDRNLFLYYLIGVVIKLESLVLDCSLPMLKFGFIYVTFPNFEHNNR
jgi:hypothetical protein